MLNDLFLTFEQQVYKSHDKAEKLDFRAYKDKDKPKAPNYNNSTYNDGLGDSATQNGVTFSNYNQNQARWAQNANQYAQNKLFDDSGADSQATQYANNLKSLGLKRYNEDMTNSLGQIQADTANRFGSLSNSDYDSSMRTLGNRLGSSLNDLNTQYDANQLQEKQNYQNYYGTLANSAQGVMGNLYSQGDNLSNKALGNNNAVNSFNQSNYAQQVAIWKAQQEQNAKMWGGIGSALGGAAGSLLGPAGTVIGNKLGSMIK